MPLKNKNLPCFFVYFKISFDGVCQPTGIVVCCHINKNTIALAYRIQKAAFDRKFPENRFQIIGSIHTFLFKDKVGGSRFIGIGQKVDSIAKGNGLPSRRQKVLVIIAALTADGKNIRVCGEWVELLAKCYPLNLAGEFCS